MSFEKRVKIALIKKDMTLADLAREMDITRAYLGDLLKGNRQTLDRIAQIKDILKDDLEEEE